MYEYFKNNPEKLINWFFGVMLLCEIVMVVGIVLDMLGINNVLDYILTIFLIIWLSTFAVIIYLIKKNWYTFKKVIRAIFLG